MKYSETLRSLGLSKNGALIYETLIRYGELSVSKIASKSEVNRRNVYDALNRLIEKGLVFEIIQGKESIYQAVDPEKLSELLREKEDALKAIMPELAMFYNERPAIETVSVYRGIEGWKNYMRDIIRTGEDFYCIGGKGAWMEERVMNIFPHFIKDAQRKKINFFHIFDHEVRDSGHDIVKYVGKNYKFFPPEHSTSCSIEVFGDFSCVISKLELGSVDQTISFTVIKNKEIAKAFRSWFKCFYNLLD